MGLVLGVMYKVTLEPIKATEIKDKTEALKIVLPEFDNNPLEAEQQLTLDGDTEPVTTYEAKKGSDVVGYAIETYTKNGFGGKFTVMVGFDTNGTIIDYKVLNHGETPGLGAKMQDWFHAENRSANTIRNFKGLSMSEEHPLKVTKDGGKVDAITASTISSRAFIDAIERAYRALQQLTMGSDASVVRAGSSGADASTSATVSATTPEESPAVENPDSLVEVQSK